MICHKDITKREISNQAIKRYQLKQAIKGYQLNQLDQDPMSHMNEGYYDMRQGVF